MGATSGNRVHNVVLLANGSYDFAPGDYGLDPARGWFGRPPNLDHAVDLGAYEVVEGDNFTITVNGGGSIEVGGHQGSNGPMFNGTLIGGVWTDS